MMLMMGRPLSEVSSSTDDQPEDEDDEDDTMVEHFQLVEGLDPTAMASELLPIVSSEFSQSHHHNDADGIDLDEEDESEPQIVNGFETDEEESV